MKKKTNVLAEVDRDRIREAVDDLIITEITQAMNRMKAFGEEITDELYETISDQVRMTIYITASQRTGKGRSK